MIRRGFLGSASALSASLLACRPNDWRVTDHALQGGYIGANYSLGHRLRGQQPAPTAPSAIRQCDVAIVGAGISGLAAARTLQQRGIHDFQLFDLEGSLGGNSRAHWMQSKAQFGGQAPGQRIACPMGAHYLPLPDPQAVQVRALLQELGILRVVHGRDVYDETMLCHSPQERLWIDGAWQAGLLPVTEDAGVEAQYQRFAQTIDRLRRTGEFAVPTSRAHRTPKVQALSAQLDRALFSSWLVQQGFTSAKLLWYLDYCCRDEYGAGIEVVSAWAGIHYFASRHGFHAPNHANDYASDPSRDSLRGDLNLDAHVENGASALLTWPAGNGYLSDRMSKPFFSQIRLESLVEHVRMGQKKHQKHEVDVWHAPSQQFERWQARAVIMAVPLFVAARVLQTPPAALQAAAKAQTHSAWWTANVLIEQPLQTADALDAMAWDNVIYQGLGLGYVNAAHQSLQSRSGPTVLTYYYAAGAGLAARNALLSAPWQSLAEQMLTDLSAAHPDLRRKAQQIDIMRYGHAMAVPTPGSQTEPARRVLQTLKGTLQFAHSDLAGYSVFEEALQAGVAAAGRAAHALGVPQFAANRLSR